MANQNQPVTELSAPVRLGVLASGNGTNFQAIIDACASGTLHAKVAIAVSNNSNAMALQRARRAGIPVAHLSSRTHPDDTVLDESIMHALVSHRVDLVVTAGYMKKLGPAVLDRFRGRIINIHPSLLPEYGGKGMYGMNVHKAVLASGDRETGVTIHHVDEHYDTGRMIAQRRVPVLPDDTPESLAKRVLAEEHRVLIDTLTDLCRPQQEELP